MPTSPSAGAFAPLRHPVFRSLWIANLASNTGMWIQNTGAGWLMTSLGVVQIRVTPKTKNPFTVKALSISGVT